MTDFRTQIAHVAELASLSLTEEETTSMAAELDAIVHYVEELSTLDTEGVPPTSHVLEEAPSLRPDEVRPGLSHEEALSGAPRSSQGGFAVPGYVEG
jgi:aspartyl-tRNA(Asn)/glutamyl-tRNA(Gln) amidotransferase subunit C